MLKPITAKAYALQDLKDMKKLLLHMRTPSSVMKATQMPTELKGINSSIFIVTKKQ